MVDLHGVICVRCMMLYLFRDMVLKFVLLIWVVLVLLDGCWLDGGLLQVSLVIELFVLFVIFYEFLGYYNFRFWLVGRGVLRFWEG